MRTEQFDVVVVGGGGAALRAAIAAKATAPALRTVILTKGKLGESGVTATACSDRMAYHATLKHTEPVGPDAWRFHAEDIYRIGGCVSDADLAAILAKNAGGSFYYLESLGVPFARREDGLADQFVTDGSQFPRACYTGPYTANHIEQALVRQIKTTPVKVLEETMAVDIVSEADRAAGLLAYDAAAGEFVIFRAKAVILATGGPGGIFAVNVYPGGMTGDGHAMALRAGAELVNMEFIQIGLSSVKTKLACSGSMFRALPRLVNDDEEEFLPRYFKGDSASMYNILFRKGASWPVSKEEPSNIIDIAVAKENAAGRKVCLDYAANPAGLSLKALDEKAHHRFLTEARQPDLKLEQLAASPLARLRLINAPVIAWLRERGIDLERGERIELAPAVQHFQGGIKIREKANTSVRGLFAAGEAAGGQHGANRPGGNALMDCQVFGKIAGEHAAVFAQVGWDSKHVVSKAEGLAGHYVERLAPGGGKLPAAEARARIQQAMSAAAGVVRTAAGLTAALTTIDGVRAAGVCTDGNGVPYALETMNMIDTAAAVLAACLARKESRGPHLFFADETTITPADRSKELERYAVISQKKGRLTAEWRQPVRSFL